MRLTRALGVVVSRGAPASVSALFCATPLFAQSTAPVDLPRVEVVGTTPLPGFDTPLRDVPANVQLFGADDLARTRPPTLSQFLDLSANSVVASSGQGNPYQEAVLFRGFAASPLLGTPQGVSVFQDGVRINEAFGDVVNWDLLPRTAIASVQLIPGSIPTFGLNTLGGALAINTKDGSRYPGVAVEAQAGSFRQRSIDAEYGTARDGLDAYATVHLGADAGWAEHNPSRIAQLFGKLRYHDAATTAEATITLADNRLEGTQTLPVSWLDTPTQAYTYPDRNDNRVAFLATRVTHAFNDGASVSANVYWRRYRNTNTSSNVNDATGDDAQDEAFSRATNDVSSIDQRTYGAGAQLNLSGHAFAVDHVATLGASADLGRTSFLQQSQPADFTSDRGTFAIGPFDTVTDAALRNRYLGVYASDTIALANSWTLLASGRYNDARIEIGDRSGKAPDLAGTHDFARFNPALGATFHPDAGFTGYATYNQGMRVPTPIELTCADPRAPCRLPNQFLADPDLRPIVSRSYEAGARGTLGSAWRYALALYRTDLADDIQFISSGINATSTGYFQNVGRTRREGIEVLFGWRSPTLQATLRYNHLDATFRTPFRASSPNNSSADAQGGIDVAPGDRIPAIPANSAKLRVDWHPAPATSIGGNFVAVASQYALGDDNNADRQGRVPGYAIVDLDAHWQIAPAIELFAMVDNALDRRYATLGILGANAFAGPDRTFSVQPGQAAIPEQFRALGMPRAFYVGVRMAM